MEPPRQRVAGPNYGMEFYRKERRDRKDGRGWRHGSKRDANCTNEHEFIEARPLPGPLPSEAERGKPAGRWSPLLGKGVTRIARMNANGLAGGRGWVVTMKNLFSALFLTVGIACLLRVTHFLEAAWPVNREWHLDPRRP